MIDIFEKIESKYTTLLRDEKIKLKTLNNSNEIINYNYNIDEDIKILNDKIKLYDIDIKYQELNYSYLDLNQQYINKDYEFNQSSLDLNIIN